MLLYLKDYKYGSNLVQAKSWIGFSYAFWILISGYSWQYIDLLLYLTMFYKSKFSLIWYARSHKSVT